MASSFYPIITNTHNYVNGTKYDNEAFSYAQKGTGHMIYSSAWEPQRTNNFELIIEHLDTLVMANSEETVANSMTGTDTTLTYATGVEDYSGKPNNNVMHPPNAAERIMLSVDSYTAPAIEIATITTNYGNNSIKWAGKPEFPNSTIVVNDYIGIQVERILSAWFRCAYDFKSEKIGLAKHYKKTGYLAEYDPKGGTARVWRLDGLWLASFNLGEWSQDGNAQRKINATLVYDRVVPDYGVDDNNNPYGTWTNVSSTSQNTGVTDQGIVLDAPYESSSANPNTSSTD